jgi:flagellar basal-body rod protein FlgB
VITGGTEGADEFRIVSTLMELSQQRQVVLANNLANANTPGYVRHDLDFQGVLSTLLDPNSSSRQATNRPEIVEDTQQSARRDGNNIVVPTELNRMMQNGLLYSLLTKAMATKLRILRTAIDGGPTA